MIALIKFKSTEYDMIQKNGFILEYRVIEDLFEIISIYDSIKLNIVIKRNVFKIL